MRFTLMRSVLAIIVAITAAGTASGHGFFLSLSYDTHGNPVGINVASQEPWMDLNQAKAGPQNLFLEVFGSSPQSDQNGTFYSVIHGFAQTAGPWPPYTATVSLISPLYFADGTGVAATLPPSGTYIDMWDAWAGNPQPATNPHPGASFGDIYINGTTSFDPGFGVSLYDAHELEKDLYIGSGSTYGAYGFAYDVTVHFANGTTLTTGPLVDVFAMSTTSGGASFAATASSAVQDAATQALYNAAMADVNFDGVVNGLDIAQVASHWLHTGSLGQLPGDANRDGVVNGLDVAMIASHWEVGGIGSSSAAAVPEPSTLLLIAVGAIFVAGRCGAGLIGKRKSPGA